MNWKIKVIVWNTHEGSGEPGSVYRLDEPTSGARFFRDLANNAETDGRESFSIEDWTPEAWAAAEKAGAELA